MLFRLLTLPFRLPIVLLILAIKMYQLTLSPDHGLLRHFFPHGVCRHTPTCSQYAVRTLKREAIYLALPLIIKRVLSCNPWTKLSEEKLRETALRR